VSFFSKVAGVYRQTQKPRDILWNRFVARPLAAALVVALAKTRITPNQVTFLSLFSFVGAMVWLALGHGRLELVYAVLVLEFSYVLDCADGQLARLCHRSSPVGAHLDFLMDELKAFMLVAATGLRLWQSDGHELWLVEALLGLTVIASAISLTTFMRRPEYLSATGAPAPRSAGDYGEGFAASAPTRSPTSVLGMVEDLGRFLIHYPSYLLLVAIADQMDVFLHVYIVTNAAYAARSLLGVVVKLARK
jgi:phosphatidylglycerophosphate synthase